MKQFHIITRAISPKRRAWATSTFVAALGALAVAPPAAANTRLQNPGPALWELSVAPEIRAQEAYLAAGGVREAARTTHVRWLAGATTRLLQGGPTHVRRLGPASFGQARADVVLAIAEAARRTGLSSSWLLRTARRESGLNPYAVSPVSTAAGLFQFVEATWLRSLRLYGAAHGLAREAERISLASDGSVIVAPGHRSGLLALRTDPQVASLMAAELARANRRAMSTSLARPVTESELYAAHFLGAAGAVRVIRAAERTPFANASKLLPQAAAANPHIFRRGGRSLTAAELLMRLADE